MKNDKDEFIPLRERMRRDSAVTFYDEDGSVSLEVDHGKIVDRKKDIDTIEEK